MHSVITGVPQVRETNGRWSNTSKIIWVALEAKEQKWLTFWIVCIAFQYHNEIAAILYYFRYHNQKAIDQDREKWNKFFDKRGHIALFITAESGERQFLLRNFVWFFYGLFFWNHIC